MTFGEPQSFAIEIGEVKQFVGFEGIYIQFRFWIAGAAFGDWDDRIPLVASIGYAQTLCCNSHNRIDADFDSMNAGEILERVYDSFFSYDYTKDPILDPNLRDRFHMDGIGMGSVVDKYGIVLVAPSEKVARIIAKDLTRERIVIDHRIPFGLVESACYAYIVWGQGQLASVG